MVDGGVRCEVLYWCFGWHGVILLIGGEGGISALLYAVPLIDSLNSLSKRLDILKKTQTLEF